MNEGRSDVGALMVRAAKARQAGSFAEARDVLRTILAGDSRFVPAWHLLGVVHLEGGHATEAAASFRAAVELDPAPPLWVNLAEAQQALGDFAAALQSTEAALDKDAYFLPAILAKGLALRALGRELEALQLYRLLFAGIGSLSNAPPAITRQLDEAKAFDRTWGDRQFAVYEQTLGQAAADFPHADLARATAFAEVRAGKRKVYHQQPSGPQFPYLPAIEFFDRQLFPWFEDLESSTQEIREELLALWAEQEDGFRPYVSYPPGTPVNQWADLNHSTRWSAWFFWEDGRRNEAACKRCPRTALALERVPVLDIPGKSPTSMYSILQPRTRIPPHTGTSNVRLTVHLPLVVPPGCGFRVGAETRDWKEGECWAFDDTIEHEAWNNSDQQRAILILDVWNPLLTEAEREFVRRLG